MRATDSVCVRVALGAISAVALGCGDGTGPADAARLPTQPIVLARLGNTGWEIVRVNPDGTGATTLTSNPGDDIYPSWSPDRTRIAFLSSRTQGDGVYVMDADGNNQRLAFRPPFGLAYTSAEPAWAPDQEWLAYGDGGSVNRIRLDGTELRRVGDGDAPSWSPDGQRIAFTWNGGIMVANTDGSDRRSVVALGVDPAWSPDGRRIAYATGRYAASFIYTVNVDGTDRRRVTTEMAESPGTTDLSPAWSRDGEWIAFQREYWVCSGRERSCKGFYDVFVTRADGTDLRKVTTDGASVRPSW
jgi:Tol biopolymer transport system component